jgi:hypothetical protein
MSNSSHSSQTLSVLQRKCQRRTNKNKTNRTQVSELNAALLSDLSCRAISEAPVTKHFAQSSIESKLAVADHLLIGGSVSKMATCKFCESEIVWSEEEDFAGDMHWVPQEPYTGLRHKCNKRQSIYVPKTINCYKCNKVITFGDKVGKNGRKVPLDPDTREAHRCPGQ